MLLRSGLPGNLASSNRRHRHPGKPGPVAGDGAGLELELLGKAQHLGLADVSVAELMGELLGGEGDLAKAQQRDERGSAAVARPGLGLAPSPASLARPHPHSRPEAICAPSASACSLAQTMLSATIGGALPTKVPKPQSTPAMTRSRPTMSA